MSQLTDLAAQLSAARAECAQLAEENQRLRRLLGAENVPVAADSGVQTSVNHRSAPPEKVALFRALFRGREDVFAVRWENRGKAGYSPACVRDWNERDADGKPGRTLLPLTDEAIFAHLAGTPVRKDGHHPIIFMQCGPVRFVVNAREQAAARPFHHIVIPRPTTFQAAPGHERGEIQALYAALSADTRRNDLIASDVLAAVRSGRSPLVLTERTAHLDELAARIHAGMKHLVILRGGMAAKQRHELADALAAIPETEPRVLLATGRYIGEGFDDARLDTLFLTMPISWRGTLQQYAGRLHRLHASKREVRIYDYVDGAVPLFNAMFDKRRKGYAAIGYEVRME